MQPETFAMDCHYFILPCRTSPGLCQFSEISSRFERNPCSPMKSLKTCRNPIVFIGSLNPFEVATNPYKKIKLSDKNQPCAPGLKRPCAPECNESKRGLLLNNCEVRGCGHGARGHRCFDANKSTLQYYKCKVR